LKNIFTFFLFVSLCLVGYSQGEIDMQEKILFQNERSISLSLNSNGFGAGYRYGKRKTYLNKVLYDIGFTYIKHPKEMKISPLPVSYATSRRYVNGKLNVFVNINPSIGFQRELFSKEDRGSIAVKYYYGGGPTIGICKPIYYSFNFYPYLNNPQIYYVMEEKYEFGQDPAYTSRTQISGRASFWKGFDELSFYPGLHAFGGVSFEYSSVNQIINAIDLGITFSAFNKKIPIMFTEYNSQFFLTLSVTYRFGWVVDTKYKAPKITREGQLLSE
jgi:hypothetical protein